VILYALESLQIKIKRKKRSRKRVKRSRIQRRIGSDASLHAPDLVLDLTPHPLPTPLLPLDLALGLPPPSSVNGRLMNR
jgi:hypothetical protein